MCLAVRETAIAHQRSTMPRLLQLQFVLLLSLLFYVQCIISSDPILEHRKTDARFQQKYDEIEKFMTIDTSDKDIAVSVI